MPYYLILFLLLIFATSDVHAGAAVARQQQMKAMQQQAYQQQVAQAMAERQQAESQAYAQAQAQYQAAQYQAAQYKAAQEYMMAQHIQQAVMQQIAQRITAQQVDQVQMQMLQQVVQQELVSQVAAQIQAKQAADVQEAMIAQAIQQAVVKLGMQAYVNEQAQQVMAAKQVLASKQLLAESQSEQFQAAKQMAADPQIQSAIAARAQTFLSHASTDISLEVFKQTVQNVLIRDLVKRMAGGNGVDILPEHIDLAVNEAGDLLGIQRVYSGAKGLPADPVLGNDVVDVVEIEDVWKKLDTSSRAWKLLIDDQAKALTINEFIGRYAKRKIRISKSPDHYVKMIDDMAMQNPGMLDNPMMGILQIVAVMEYDFDYGGDRDALARKILGPMYESNKQRLSSSH